MARRYGCWQEDNPHATTSPFDQVTRGRTSVEIDKALRAYMLHVYNYMVLGLAITGLAALGIYMILNFINSFTLLLRLFGQRDE